MFASETLLKNVTVATLELCTHNPHPLSLDNNQPRWWLKDSILTDRGLYMYPEKGDILGEQYGTPLKNKAL